MSLLGKILVILNVLAAAGFLYLASQVWAQRLQWEDAALQHDLLNNGLPVDEDDKDREGFPKYKDLRTPLVKKIFPSDPVKTQKEEAERVRKKLLARLDDSNLPGTKAQELARILVPLADEGEDRLRLYKRALDPAVTAPKEEELQQRFDAAFDTVVSPSLRTMRPDGSTEDKKPRDWGEQRRSYATLLGRLCEVLRDDEIPDAKTDAKGNQDAMNAPIKDWKCYQRYLNVVGLAAAQKAMDDYTVALERATEGMQAAVDRDRDQFAANMTRKLAVLDDYAARVEAEKYAFNIEKERATKTQEQANKTRVEFDKVEGEMRKQQAETKKMLKEQADMERTLFASRQRMRDAFAENQRLERQIRELERGRERGEAP
jgi:hypothetical protein